MDYEIHITFDIWPSCLAISQAMVAKACRELKGRYRDFPGLHGIWREGPDGARGIIARCMSKHGLTGKVYVRCMDTDPQDRPGMWTGFVPRKGLATPAPTG